MVRTILRIALVAFLAAATRALLDAQQRLFDARAMAKAELERAQVARTMAESAHEQAKADLDQINEALIGFALAQPKPYLPCPDTNNDGISDACPNTNSTETTGGNIPWVTLNVPANDPWGQPYQYLNPGVKGEIDVFSFGADGQSGGEGHNADIGSWE